MFSDKCKKNKPQKILYLGDTDERMKTIQAWNNAIQLCDSMYLY